jgi:asparagine N-glycosylation enzyme membrane subunit Stt3
MRRATIDSEYDIGTMGVSSFEEFVNGVAWRGDVYLHYWFGTFIVLLLLILFTRKHTKIQTISFLGSSTHPAPICPRYLSFSSILLYLFYISLLCMDVTEIACVGSVGRRQILF